MTHTIELENRTLILTDEELRRIYEVQLDIYHRQDLENTLELEYDAITEAARAYIADNMDCMVTDYTDACDNGAGWQEAARYVIDNALDDYEAGTGISAWEE